MARKKKETMHNALPVAGYKAQSEERVKLVNANKQAEERLLRGLDALAREPNIDQRWLKIAYTHFEQGFMALNRSIFMPERVKLPEDV
jgi:hypothetical protein